MVGISFSIDIVLKIDLDLVVHLGIDIDASKTRRDANDAKSDTGQSDEPVSCMLVTRSD